MNEIVRREDAVFDPAALLQEVIRQGITPDKVESLSKLADLANQQQSRRAEREFAEAFAALRSELPIIEIEKAVPGKGGGVRFMSRSFREIEEQLAPYMVKRGFSTRFSSEYMSDPPRVRVTCFVRHISGHEVSSDCTIRAGQAEQAAWSDLGAMSNGMKGALILAFGLRFQSSDAANEGRTITEDEAAMLRARAGYAFGGDAAQIRRVLSLAGAEDWRDIRQAKFEVVSQHLVTVERTKFKAHDPWFEAMVGAASDRWGCDMGSADRILKGILSKRSGEMDVDARVRAWVSLHAGELDRFK